MSQAVSFGSGVWSPALEGDQAAKAVSTAREVTERFRDCGCVATAYEAAARQTAFPKSVHWQPYGIAQGDAGLALMCGYLDACFPDEDWDTTAHRCLLFAAVGAESSGYLPTGLFAG